MVVGNVLATPQMYDFTASVGAQTERAGHGGTVRRQWLKQSGMFWCWGKSVCHQQWKVQVVVAENLTKGEDVDDEEEGAEYWTVVKRL